MGKGKPKKGGPGLGRALQKQRFGTAGKRTHEQQTEIYTAAIANEKAETALKLRSMTETSDLVELMHNAALAEADFTAQKANTIMITKDSFSTAATENVLPSQEALDRLRLPRRPSWSKEMSAEELDAQERAAFLEWRRNLAALEEEQKLVFTPFEKNLEVWRQLWRVVERSDIVLQIVDARNPLLFFSRDLQAFVQEVDESKQHVVLVNKADFLSLRSRLAWARYFERHNIKFLFWSANWETLPAALQTRLQTDMTYEVPALNLHVGEDEAEQDSKVKGKRDAAAAEGKQTEETDAGDDEGEEEGEGDDEEEAEEDGAGEDEGGDEEEAAKPAPAASAAPVQTYEAKQKEEKKDEDEKKAEGEAKATTEAASDSVEHAGASASEIEAAHICARDELLARLVKMAGKESKDGERTVVGTVGYPNVGKSSTINVLAGAKRVTVSATPGKTKRFQTLLITDNITLVDCPGLVFPNLLASKAEMICNGLLPIDQLRDAIPPVSLVCDRISRAVLEQRYGIVLPEPDPPGSAPAAHDLLQAYGYIRGFMTAHGSPDESRAARLVLKDYVSGRLLFCHKPPADDTPKSLAHSISPPLHHLPPPLFHVPRPASAAPPRTPTMRQSSHEAAFDRQASVTASTSGRSGGGDFTRITRPFSPVPLVKPAPRAKGPKRVVNLSRLAAPSSALAADKSKKLG